MKHFANFKNKKFSCFQCQAHVEVALDSSKSRVGRALDSSKSSHVNQCHWKHKKEKRIQNQPKHREKPQQSPRKEEREGEKEERRINRSRRRRWKLWLAICARLLICCFNFAQPLLCHRPLLSLFVCLFFFFFFLIFFFKI